MAVNTRVPEEYGVDRSSEGAYAWERDENGDLVMTGNQGLVSGQAWTYDANGNLIDAGTPITDDPYWTRDGDDNLVEILPV